MYENRGLPTLNLETFCFNYHVTIEFEICYFSYHVLSFIFPEESNMYPVLCMPNPELQIMSASMKIRKETLNHAF